jgi:glycosyltransferase involved in cell wall biosynthesis
MQKEKMLYVGDFPVHTGFGVVSDNLISTFRKHYDMHILGINYFGDYHPSTEGLKVYVPSANGDIFGFDRFEHLLFSLEPAVVFILNDVWIASDYGKVIKRYKEEKPEAKTKFILYTPIDAENIKTDFIMGVQIFDALVTYTEFGRRQIELSGGHPNIQVIPHGVDLTKFKRFSQKEVRRQINMPEDCFVVLYVARNQPRKRLDLFFYIFAEWVKKYNLPKSVKAYYHGGLRDIGIDIIQWVNYLGIQDHLALSNPNLTPSTGLTTEQLNLVYNSADVFFATTAAEGWGLPVAEAMAVGVPCVLPNHSALADWPEGNALLVDCYKFPTLTDRGLNTIHHVVHIEEAVEALHKMYTDATFRKELGDKSHKFMQQEKFNWTWIGNQFMKVIKDV